MFPLWETVAKILDKVPLRLVVPVLFLLAFLYGAAMVVNGYAESLVLKE